MTDWLINLDHSITLGLNGMHTPFWNEVMLFLSAKTVWIPLYAAIAILFFVPRWYGEKSQALTVFRTQMVWEKVSGVHIRFQDSTLADRPHRSNGSTAVFRSY